jgi:hypothetical protein
MLGAGRNACATKAGLLVALSDEAEVGAEAEALDADLERSAAAVEQVFEQGLQEEGALDVFFHLFDFAVSQFFPTGADRGIFAEAVEEELDLAEGEAHLAGEADEQDAVKCVGGVATLAADAVRSGEKPHFLVVTDGGSVDAGAGGE